MPSVINAILPTTELDAINVMLGALGESPLDSGADLSTLQNTDGNVQMAVTILRETTRELLAAGWRFNTLTGYELGPAASFDWLDSSGTTTTLNIFKVPSGGVGGICALHWKQTPCRENSDIELIERPSLKYTEGAPALSTMVLFDRVKNRDGAEKARYPFLYLDLVTTCDFEQMPECARRVAAVIAARRLCARLPASQTEAQFSAEDASAAVRVLRREQGLRQNLNLFETADAMELGGRRWGLGGGYSAKVFPGGGV